MNRLLLRLGTTLILAATLAGCGGGSSGPAAPPPAAAPPTVQESIAAAAAVAANDTSTSTSASFSVVQTAGVPAVSITGPQVVNFTVLSGGRVVEGLAVSNGSVRFNLAKLVPGTNSNPDQWVNYIHRTESTATAPNNRGSGPSGTPVLATARQATTDTFAASRLTYNPAGYYTYTFNANITDPANPSNPGGVFERNRTHRIGMQLSYRNAAGETVLVNPYFDFTVDAAGNSVPVTDPALTRKMTDVGSCNSCHEKLALHGGGRVDTQYCVMCHNPGTTDANSANNLNLVTMVHKIHSGKLLQRRPGGETYRIWGFNGTEFDFSKVGFPQDLRNCTKCHSADTPEKRALTPQGDNWKTRPSKEACLTCHASGTGSVWRDGTTTSGITVGSHTVFAATLVGAGAAATDLTNAQCAGCHVAGSNISPERVHWNQNEENAAKYRLNIDSATYNPSTRRVTVAYSLTDPTNGNAAYNLVTPDCASPTSCSNQTRFGNLRFYVAYQNMVGQSTAVTEFSSYNNGGSGANAFAYLGLNNGANRYTIDIALPADVPATAVAFGTARVIGAGQIKEPLLQAKWATDPRPEVVPRVLVNTAVQHTHRDVVLSGVEQARREVVSNDKCNACHALLGTGSGSNTLDNAFHSGARNTVEACVMCHDANRMSSGKMTNGIDWNESRQFKRLIHGIHGNSKRTYPFSPGNTVVAAFNKDGTRIGGGAPLASTNYAAEVAWPGVGINCNACHVNNSYQTDRGTLGTVIRKGTGVTDPNLWSVISPKAASCTACHDSPTAISHVTTFGGATFGNLSQAAWPRETCDDCHSSGGFRGVDIVHGQR